MRIFLSGPMGAGKSSIGPLLATKLSVPFFDLDTYIEQRSGRSIADIFKESGEYFFRNLESQTIRKLVGERASGVFSLGGGTVTQEPLRRWLLEQGKVFFLCASVEELVKRVSRSQNRPLLLGEEDPSRRLKALVAERAEAYAECHGRFDTESVDLKTLVEDLAKASLRRSVVVPLGKRTYKVDIGHEIFSEGLACMRAEKKSSKIFLVQDQSVQKLWGKKIEQLLFASGLDVSAISIEGGEDKKNIRTVEKIWDEALSQNVDRSSWMLGVGGGVLGDMAAFSASTLMRGIRLGQFPTTLLSMVDSSVGGKTGFNRVYGKNLVGTFYQPRFVVCDIQCLCTLPQQELIAGFAEVVKSAWIAGDEAVALLEQLSGKLIARDPEALIDAIEMSVRLKSNIVARDEHEAGTRMLLNLGHTVGHALEASGDYTRYRHGEAVSLGMVAAMELSEKLGVLAKGQKKRLMHLLEKFGLPSRLEEHLNEKVLSYLKSDKKRNEDAIDFVLPEAPGKNRIERIAISEITSILGTNVN